MYDAGVGALLLTPAPKCVSRRDRRGKERSRGRAVSEGGAALYGAASCAVVGAVIGFLNLPL